MRSVNLTWIAIIGFIAQTLYGQIPADSVRNTSFPNSIGIRIGGEYFANRDPLASPFNHAGLGLPIQLVYFRTSASWRHEASLRFRASNLSSKYSGQYGGSSQTAELIYLQMRYSLAHRVKDYDNHKTKIFAGMLWNTVFSFRNYNYAEGLEEETVAEVFTGLNPYVFVEHALSPESRLFGQSHIALVTLAYRNPYSLATDRDAATATNKSFVSAFLHLSKWYGINRLFYWNTTFGYETKLSKHWICVLDYDFTWYRFNQSRVSTTVTESLTAGLRYAF